MGDLVELDSEELVGVKRRLRNLQESCRVKRWKVPEIEIEAVYLAVEPVDDTVLTSPGAADVVDPFIDELGWQLPCTKTGVISLTSKLYNLEEVRNNAKSKHEELLKKLRTEAKLPEDCIGPKRGGALSCCHGGRRPI